MPRIEKPPFTAETWSSHYKKQSTKEFAHLWLRETGDLSPERRNEAEKVYAALKEKFGELPVPPPGDIEFDHIPEKLCEKWKKTFGRQDDKGKLEMVPQLNNLPNEALYHFKTFLEELWNRRKEYHPFRSGMPPLLPKKTAMTSYAFISHALPLLSEEKLSLLHPLPSKWRQLETETSALPPKKALKRIAKLSHEGQKADLSESVKVKLQQKKPEEAKELMESPLYQKISEELPETALAQRLDLLELRPDEEHLEKAYEEAEKLGHHLRFPELQLRLRQLMERQAERLLGQKPIRRERLFKWLERSQSCKKELWQQLFQLKDSRAWRLLHRLRPDLGGGFGRLWLQGLSRLKEEELAPLLEALPGVLSENEKREARRILFNRLCGFCCKNGGGKELKRQLLPKLFDLRNGALSETFKEFEGRELKLIARCYRIADPELIKRAESLLLEAYGRFKKKGEKLQLNNFFINEAKQFSPERMEEAEAVVAKVCESPQTAVRLCEMLEPFTDTHPHFVIRTVTRFFLNHADRELEFNKTRLLKLIDNTIAASENERIYHAAASFLGLPLLTRYFTENQRDRRWEMLIQKSGSPLLLVKHLPKGEKKLKSVVPKERDEEKLRKLFNILKEKRRYLLVFELLSDLLIHREELASLVFEEALKIFPHVADEDERVDFIYNFLFSRKMPEKMEEFDERMHRIDRLTRAAKWSPTTKNLKTFERILQLLIFFREGHRVDPENIAPGLNALFNILLNDPSLLAKERAVLLLTELHDRELADRPEELQKLYRRLIEAVAPFPLKVESLISLISHHKKLFNRVDPVEKLSPSCKLIGDALLNRYEKWGRVETAHILTLFADYLMSAEEAGLFSGKKEDSLNLLNRTLRSLSLNHIGINPLLLLSILGDMARHLLKHHDSGAELLKEYFTFLLSEEFMDNSFKNLLFCGAVYTNFLQEKLISEEETMPIKKRLDEIGWRFPEELEKCRKRYVNDNR